MKTDYLLLYQRLRAMKNILNACPIKKSGDFEHAREKLIKTLKCGKTAILFYHYKKPE